LRASNSIPFVPASRWQVIVALAAIGSITLSLLLRFISIEGKILGIGIENIPLFILIFLAGFPLLIQISAKILKKDFGADLLAALSLVIAVILGEYLVAALIILMLSGGQALESYAIARASSALAVLAERMPAKAHRKRGSTIQDIPLSEINMGDSLVVFPHETCPVDGIVEEGYGVMDESYLTGEPYLISKAPGITVLSGAINGASALVITVEKMPSDSRYAKIMKVMKESEQKRPKLRRLGDQLGVLFTPIALGFALVTWYFTGEVGRLLAVLVIATPCPLLIAIPVTIISAISLAARRGILIKDPVVLERLPTCRIAIFDKTGTLTLGKPELTEIIMAPDRLSDQILQEVASLERYSKHPLAGAILQAAEKKKLPLLGPTHICETPGQGLKGVIRGREIHITHRTWLLKECPEMAKMLPPTRSGLECIILQNGQYTATMFFRDTPRPGGKSFVGHLAPSHRFKRIILVSGDRKSEVVYLAETLGIKEIYASQSPEQKLSIVQRETQEAPTLFMGDGINDAPAFPAATVSIAFGQYSHAITEAAGAVIMESSLTKVDELIHISLATRRIVLQSALGGILLSIIGMGFASGGFISPVMGALLQEGIDVFAILNALRFVWGTTIVVDMPLEKGQAVL
jgi:heavy metal translocating P-type ATPase